MEDIEKLEAELLANPAKLSCMNNLLKAHQFTEKFLIETREYYDSWKCLKYQKNLSAYFCFRYLYDTPEYDSADDWTDYNQVIEYLTKLNIGKNLIDLAYKQAMDNRNHEN